jgi:hypothetical protein
MIEVLKCLQYIRNIKFYVDEICIMASLKHKVQWNESGPVSVI